jgi:precorrin-6B methylase 2
MPLAVALGAQALAGFGVFGAALVVARITAWQPPLIVLLALHGLAAALLGRRLGLAKWWTPIQMALPIAVAAVLGWQVPGWVFLAVFVGLVLVFWNSARGGVPLYLTNTATKAALADLLPPENNFRFADLGCGLGGPALNLSRVRPDGHFTGIESAPALFLAASLRRRLSGTTNADIVFGDFWLRNLGEFDVVYCFLSPVPMPALFEKACLEMKPGSLLISNSFDVPAKPADVIVEVDDARNTKLHLWRM